MDTHLRFLLTVVFGWFLVVSLGNIVTLLLERKVRALSVPKELSSNDILCFFMTGLLGGILAGAHV